PKEDTVQLWKRVVFHVLVSNTDDHLRNHGFLCESPAGWRLSPAYDMNPVPVDVKPRVLTTAIAPDDPAASLDLALKCAGYFGVKHQDGRRTAAEIAAVVSNWWRIAANADLDRAAIDRMASAFEHEDLKKGLMKSARIRSPQR